MWPEALRWQKLYFKVKETKTYSSHQNNHSLFLSFAGVMSCLSETYTGENRDWRRKITLLAREAEDGDVRRKTKTEHDKNSKQKYSLLSIYIYFLFGSQFTSIGPHTHFYISSPLSFLLFFSPLVL